MTITIQYTPKVVWQSDKAKKFYCPNCGVWIRTQYEGDGKATLVECNGRFGSHTLEINEPYERRP